MKKIIFLCLCALLVSCSSDEELQDVIANEGKLSPEELENVINDYELVLKGYTLDELSKEKDELTPTTQEETDAEPWLISELQKASKETMLSNYGKVRSDAKAYASTSGMVGVFKTSTCGSYREFVYDMDCEDGGDSQAIGEIGATFVDGNRNVRFYFCLVPAGNYGGGTLLLHDYTWYPSEGDVDVLARYHDNEDHNNKNRIIDNGGLASTGVSKFEKNTILYWRFSEKPAQPLYISYAVLTNFPAEGPVLPHQLFIDDENGNNTNSAILWTHRATQQGLRPPFGTTTSRYLNKGEVYRGMMFDRNTRYNLKMI